MGGNNAGEMSATCYYWGLELHTTQKIPIGLIHSSYGGSAVEDWISKETLGTGGCGTQSREQNSSLGAACSTFGLKLAACLCSPNSKCPGKITSSMGLPSQQWNGQIVPLLNTTIKGTIWYQASHRLHHSWLRLAFLVLALVIGLQGESNHGQNELYTCRYEQMMSEWRTQWHIGTGGSTDINMPMGEFKRSMHLLAYL